MYCLDDIISNLRKKRMSCQRIDLLWHSGPRDRGANTRNVLACLVLAGLLLPVFSAAQSARVPAARFSDSFLPGDEIVETIRHGFARAGRASPFTSFPVGLRQCEAAAAELGRDPAADPDTLARLGNLLESLRGSAVEVSLDLSYRANLRTADELVEPYEKKSGIDLYRLYLDEPAPFRLTLGFSGESGLAVLAEDTLRREYRGQLFRFDNFWQLGDPDNPVGIENHDFTRGYLSWSRDRFRVLFGRDRVHFGPETFSSLLVSDRLPYWDSLRVNLPVGPVRMDWYVATIPAMKVDGTPLLPQDPYSYVPQDPADPQDPTIILDALHRFEWRTRSFRVAVAGNVTYVRPNNYFEISDFFPVLSWHSNDVIPNNLRLILDFSWVFLPGWTLSGQAGYDDISAEIFGVGDNPVPTVDAYILGLRRDGGTPERRRTAILEGGFTHYLWGSFDEVATSHGTPSSGTLARAIYRFRLDWSAEALPLTSPYGPGAAWVKGAYILRQVLPDLDLRADALVLSKNREANLLATVFLRDPAVQNAARTLYTEISAEALYTLAGFTFRVRPLFAVRDGTPWFELSLGATLGLHSKISVSEEL